MKIPMLIFPQKIVYGTMVDNLTIVIMEALQKCGGLNLKFVAKRSFILGLMG
jgi:hypothetical protein